MLRLLGSLNAFPLTLLGFVLALFGGCSLASYRGTLEAIAPRRGPWAWFFARGWAAITFGEVVVYKAGAWSPELVRHELEHVRQQRALGLLFVPLYLVVLPLWCLVRGRHPYRDNPLEIAARRAAGQS